MKTHRIFLKKIIRSIKENWKNFIAVIVISFLALALFSGLTANYKTLQRRVDKLYRDGNIADIYVYVNEYDIGDIEFLESVDGVRKVETRTSISGNYLEKSFNLLVAKSTNEMSIPILESGNEGFLVDKNFAESSNLEVGNTYDFSFSNQFKKVLGVEDLSFLDSLINEGKSNVLNGDNLILDLEVTGIMSHPEAVENSRFGTGVAYCYDEYFLNMIDNLIDENYKSEISPFLKSYVESRKDQLLNSQILIKSDAEDTLEIIDEYFGSKDNNNLLISMNKDTLPANIGIQSDIIQAKKLTYVFPVIFFLVSVLVILTTLSQMIAKERTQIGTMKAIGITKKNIFVHYISYGLILTLMGSIIGIILGPLFIPSVMNIKYELLWSLPKMSVKMFNWESILCSSILIFLSAFVSFLVVRKEVNLKPVDSLRPAAPKNYKSSPKRHKIFDKLSIPSKMAYRNIVRNKVKSAMVVLGTLGCSALLVCGFGIMDTLNYGIDYDLNRTIPFDISISYSNNDESNLKSQILNIEGVDRVEEYLTMPVKIQGSATYETTISLIDGESQLFKEPYSGDGVVLSKSVAENIKCKKGDEITLLINGIKYMKVVDEIFDSCFVKGVFDIKSNYEAYAQTSNNKAWVISSNSKNNDTIAELINNIDGIEKTITNEEQKEYANNLLSSIQNMTRVIEIFAILLAIVVIFNLANLNIKERSRDIATMKVLGFNKKEISKTLITEIMVLTIIGSIIGLFFGYPMCVLVLSINKTQLISFMYHVAALSYVYSIILSIGTGLIINLIIMKRAHQIKMVESLKSVE